MLSNAYFLAKLRFDTAENEPAKKFAKFSKNAFSKNAYSKNAFFSSARGVSASGAPGRPRGRPSRQRRGELAPRADNDLTKILPYVKSSSFFQKILGDI